MMDSFFLPATAPFAIAIVLMFLIALAEVAGALIGMPASAALDNLLPEIDADVDLDADYSGGPLDVDAANVPNAPTAGPLSQLLGWLCVGRVPVLVLLIVFLTAFGLVGFFVQGAVTAIFGAPAPVILAVAPAIAAAFPATRIAGLALAKVMPKEQTEAVSQRQFIGKVAVIIRGEAKPGQPAEAKLTDRFGQTHYVLVEPDDGQPTFSQGASVLIVRQLGGRFVVIANTSAALHED